VFLSVCSLTQFLITLKLTRKLLDPHLTMNQIIALRFTSDKEFLSLCEKAANDGIAPDTIKKRGRPIIIG